MNHINKDTLKYLTPTEPRTARFYHLPKIHKAGNPGRPIVSSCGAPTERISEYVDHHLHPLVVQIPSYLRDTTDFLRKLSTLETLPPGSILVTLDVSSLYTNIPHNEGVAACREALETRPSLAPPTNYLVDLIQQILTLNNFTFNGEHYLQTQGTAMGTRMAPSYANLFMAKLEETLLTQTTISPRIWWRYIDDVFAIWDKGQDELENFLQQINTFHNTIKFTAEWSTDPVSFLDTTVILDAGTIHTDLYTKPTDTHQYLSPESCHPKHCTTSIPYSQSLRIRRICSRDEDYTKRTEELKEHLKGRGYRDTTVDTQIQLATQTSREEALLPRPRRPALERIPLVVTYRPGLTKLSSIVRKHLPTLHISDKLRKAIPNPPLVAYRRPPNLRDLLVRAEVKTPTPPTLGDNAPCGSRRCKTCPLIKHTNTFTSNTTGRRYTIRNQFTCKTKNIVYMISCNKCNKQYVGETENALHIRMNGHRSDITTKKLDKPVAAHFNQPDHSYEDLRVMGIEKIEDHNNSRKRRKLRERYWIFELRTLTPEGLNIED